VKKSPCALSVPARCHGSAPATCVRCVRLA
jgi:hypothetical protein